MRRGCYLLDSRREEGKCAEVDDHEAIDVVIEAETRCEGNALNEHDQTVTPVIEEQSKRTRVPCLIVSDAGKYSPSLTCLPRLLSVDVIEVLHGRHGEGKSATINNRTD